MQLKLLLIFRLMLASHRPVTVNFFFHRARLVNGKEMKDGLEIRHNSLIHHQLSLARSPAHDGDAHDGDDAPRPPRPVHLRPRPRRQRRSKCGPTHSLDGYE